MNLDIYQVDKSTYQIALIKLRNYNGLVQSLKCCIKLNGDRYQNHLPRTNYSSYEKAQEALNKKADQQGYRWIGRNDGIPILEGTYGNLNVIGKLYV